MSTQDRSPFRFRAAADAAEVQCRRCLRLRPFADLDRMFWCEECRTTARRLAARWGRIGALAGAALVAVWVGIGVRPPSVRLQILYAVAVLAVYRIRATACGGGGVRRDADQEPAGREGAGAS